MSELFLIEKYDDATPIPPIGVRPDSMVVLPLDSEFIDPSQQDLLTRDTIRSQPDYIQAVNPIVHLHSMLQNKFYFDFCHAITEEQQNLIDHANILKTLFDIDYYDGDQERFLEKTDHLAHLLNVHFPLEFVNYTNAEYSPAMDITRQNDFRRVMLKKAWLTRRWAGTARGYGLPMRFLNRRGAVHIAVKYKVEGIVTSLTNKVFRLIDPLSYATVLPNNPDSVFPDAGHIEGLMNISEVKPPSYKWDMGILNDYGWKEPTVTTTAMAPVGDYSPYRTDQYISLSSSERQLYMEISLDRLLLHYNSKGTATSLLDNEFLKSLEKMLPAVQRAQDLVGLGSQLTLVTSNDGRYNTLSGDLNYSHPNIRCKFQTFKYLEDKVTSNWDFAKVNSIKVGQGGYNVTTIDNNVFVKTGQSPTSPDKVIPLDLQAPIFEMGVGENEKSATGDYNILSTAIHSRDIDSSNIASTVTINGSNASVSSLKVTTLTLADQMLATGTFSLGIDFDLNIPELQVLPLSSGLSFTAIANDSAGVFSFDVAAIGSAVAPCTIKVGDVLRTITSVDATDDMTAVEVVASQIVNNPIDPITDPASDDWTFTVEGTHIVATTKIIEQHQRLLVYQQLNPDKYVYDPKVRWQERSSDGSYVDFQESFMPYGYITTREYATDYFPVVRKNIVNLIPLTVGDIHDSLRTGLTGWWDMTNGLQDVSGTGANGTLTGSTEVTGIRGKGRLFDGSSHFGTLPVPAARPKTIAFWYQGTDAGGVDTALTTRHVLVGLIKSNNSSVCMSVGIVPGGYISFRWEDSSFTARTLVSTTVINDNVPHLIMVTHSGTSAYLIIDNKVEAVNLNTSYTSTAISSVYLMRNGSNYSVYTQGMMDELRFYDRALSSKESRTLRAITATLDDSVLDSRNNPVYTYIDEIEGKVYTKLQYDPTGLLSDKGFIDTGYSSVPVKLRQKYQLGVHKDIVGISEMGLFDASGTLMAYATFPPVIYDPVKYHLSFNLLIQKDA
jgi:hypothetical protein